MELIEHIAHALELVVEIFVLVLEAISVFCVLVGLLRALANFPGWNADSQRAFAFLRMRFAFARWLSLALEFQLAVDILETTLEPSVQDLMRLAIIAIIRTLLNYFLGKEMMEWIEAQEKEQTSAID